MIMLASFRGLVMGSCFCSAASFGFPAQHHAPFSSTDKLVGPFLSFFALACSSSRSLSLRRAASASSVLRFKTACTHECQLLNTILELHTSFSSCEVLERSAATCMAQHQVHMIHISPSGILHCWDSMREATPSIAPAACCAWPGAAAALHSAAAHFV